MNCLITGHKGFIGRSLLETKWIKSYKPILYNRGDDLFSLPPIDYIINLAGNSNDSPIAFFRDNVAFTFELLNHFQSVNTGFKHFIQIGSYCEYLPTVYGVTKLCGTTLCDSYANTYNLPITVIRFPYIYGKNEGINRITSTFINETHVIIDPKATYDFIYIKDALNIIRTIMKKPHTVNVLPVGSGKRTSELELCQIIEQVTGKNKTYTLVNKNRQIPHINDSQALRQYNIGLEYDLVSGIKDYINEL